MQQTVSTRSGVSLFRSGNDWSWRCQYCGSNGAGRNVNRHIKTAEHQKRLNSIELAAFDEALKQSYN